MRAFSVKAGTKGLLLTLVETANGMFCKSTPFEASMDQLFMVEDIAFDAVKCHNQACQLNVIEKDFLENGFIGFKSGNPKQRMRYTFGVHQSKVEGL